MKLSFAKHRCSTVTLILGCLLATPIALSGQRSRPPLPDLSKEVAEAKATLGLPVTQRALQYIERKQGDPKELIDTWVGLCNAAGPSGDEIYRSTHIKKLFQIYGLENVHIDGALNVIGIRPGTGGGPTVVLNAHEDQISIFSKDQPIEAFIADGRIWCPGAGDDLIGIVQMIAILEAMNSSKMQTKGDVWFVTFTGEETDFRGGRHFARSNYPHHIDWSKGDVVMQFHGQGGGGATTGSTPLIDDAKLWFFTPFERQIEGQEGSDRRWRAHGVDALAKAIIGIREQLTDPTRDCLRCAEVDQRAQFYVNMAMVQGMPVRNTPGSEAWVRLDLRSETKAGMQRAHSEIVRVANEACKGIEGCRYQLEVMSRLGLENEIPGWDKVNNRGARMAAATSQVLYGNPGLIDPTRGCGDCQGTYMEGLPSMSLRGDIVDYGKGKFERTSKYAQYGGLESDVRLRTSGHHATQSQQIVTLWAAAKHGLLFTATYAGVANGGK
ncbi:MAG TPA: M20/M25/M40 family metallo-hydrolase [Gemmatimonadaceae bacterium]|nr:M20/M25/M40 family metallo-hydrolase [Gemmatimonadaceae bacterium]